MAVGHVNVLLDWSRVQVRCAWLETGVPVLLVTIWAGKAWHRGMQTDLHKLHSEKHGFSKSNHDGAQVLLRIWSLPPSFPNFQALNFRLESRMLHYFCINTLKTPLSAKTLLQEKRCTSSFENRSASWWITEFQSILQDMQYNFR